MDDGKKVGFDNVQGLKASEIKPVREVLGDDFPAEELPAGVRAYIKEKAKIFPEGQALDVYVYEYENGSTTGIKKLVGKLKDRTTCPEDDEIAENFGPGVYFWIVKWPTRRGQDSGILSDLVRVSEKARPLYEAFHARKGAEAARASVPVMLASAPVPAAGNGFSFSDLMKLQADAEEKVLGRMERMAAMFKTQAQPADIMADAYRASNQMIKEGFENNLAMRKTVMAEAKAVIKQKEGEGEDGEPEDSDSVGALVKSMIPKIRPFLDQLLGGGPVGSAVKTIVLGTDEWKEIFRDKEKFGVAVAAMEQEFGSDKTQSALDILLNRRVEKKKSRK